MRIFVAHSRSPAEVQLAALVAKKLRKASGYAVLVGDRVAGSSDPVLDRLCDWPTISLASMLVSYHISKADVLVAVCLGAAWRQYNVPAEIGWFGRGADCTES